jgi:hypothetical protein
VVIGICCGAWWSISSPSGILFFNRRFHFPALSIRWLFVAYALFSFMSVIGYATETPITAGAFITWGPILLALSILMAVYFQKIKPPVI